MEISIADCDMVGSAALLEDGERARVLDYEYEFYI